MIISFNKNFYNLKAVKNTVEAYKALADFDIKTNKKVIALKASNIDKEVKSMLKDEFCNYVLSEMKKYKTQCLLT